jgi:hypothetical protein
MHPSDRVNMFNLVIAKILMDLKIQFYWMLINIVVFFLSKLVSLYNFRLL